MPDFAMCLNNTCTKRSTCMRYRAVPDSQYQAFAYFGEKNCKGCEMQWNIQGWNNTQLISLKDADNRNGG